MKGSIYCTAVYTALWCILHCGVYCTVVYTVLQCILHCSVYCSVYCTAVYTALQCILHCGVYCTAVYTAVYTILQCILHCSAVSPCTLQCSVPLHIHCSTVSPCSSLAYSVLQCLAYSVPFAYTLQCSVPSQRSSQGNSPSLKCGSVCTSGYTFSMTTKT